MEPRVESIVLHPSLLMASGIECISSRDARFLNAYKKYFGDFAWVNNEAIMLTEEDFKLGGIMNPNDLFIIPGVAFNKCLNKWYSFPCMTRRQIFENVYQVKLNDIFERILEELTIDMKNWAKSGNLNDISVLLIKPATSGEIYSKIVALHLCGLGDKLRDAFSYLLHRYQKLNDSN